MNIKNKKIYERNKYKKIRTIAVKKYNDIIFSKVVLTLEDLFNINKNKSYIGIYWPIKNEVDLRPLKQLDRFSLALPASTNSKGVNYHPWLYNSLENDINGIPSPIKSPPLNPDQINLLLVPALAIDHEGYRLGYGGGYFDRLRSDPNWKSIKAITVIPEACISASRLPRNYWDIPFDGWISEKGFHQIKT